jgi:hypothetical protein
MRLALCGLTFGFALALGGCQVFSTTCADDDPNCLAPVLKGGTGEDCGRAADCKYGLSCVNGTCEAVADKARGDTCRLSAECEGDGYCAAIGTVANPCRPDTGEGETCRRCVAAGSAGMMEACLTSAECERGLVCEPPNVDDITSLNDLASGVCRPEGNKDQGIECDSASDCMSGLICGPLPVIKELPPPEDPNRTICQSVPIELPAIPMLWDGVECDEESGATRAMFEVPRGGEDPGEFYNLPLPNDIRDGGGLAGHPAPPDSLGLPFVANFIDAATADLDGASTNAAAYFRFSEPFDFESVTGESIRIVDVTPSSPGYGQDAGIEWRTTEGRVSNYICNDWLAFRRPVGSPLRPGTTYAAIVTNAVRPEAGGNFARGKDFSDMLANSAPSDADLAAAHASFKPLRDWLADENQNADAILNATVFTTQSADDLIKRLRDAIDEANAPTVSDLTVCESASTTSPCEDADRGTGCSAASDDFIEIHGRIRLPIFQRGDAPYLREGGDIRIDGGGNAVVTRQEDVCFALAVPTADVPEEGSPVLVYAHGTGGAFDGQMGRNGYAQAMATASTPIATMAIDMPQHGSRRGDSDEDPDALFFNFLNPRAARGNAAQGAADLMAVVKWVQQGGLSAGQSPTGSAIALDGNSIALFGHSQGSTHAALMVSYEPGVVAAVLSGLGGHLATALRTKTSPVDIGAALPFALMDPNDDFELAGGDFNPALTVVQDYYDAVDPINFARHIYREPTSVAPAGHHVLVTYGRGDTYTPGETTAGYARAGGLTHVQPVLEAIDLSPAASPVSGNVTVDGMSRTVGLRQYDPVDVDDGHFVATGANEDGRVDAVRFLSQALSGSTPNIGP